MCQVQLHHEGSMQHAMYERVFFAYSQSWLLALTWLLIPDSGVMILSEGKGQIGKEV